MTFTVPPALVEYVRHVANGDVPGITLETLASPAARVAHDPVAAIGPDEAARLLEVEPTTS